MDEVGELDLGDRDQPVQRRADGHAHDGRFRQRRVEHARLAEPRVQPIGGAEHATLSPHVLAQHEHAFVALHLLGDRGADRLDHPHLWHPKNIVSVARCLDGIAPVAR
jgi:hypothetical protein